MEKLKYLCKYASMQHILRQNQKKNINCREMMLKV